MQTPNLKLREASLPTEIIREAPPTLLQASLEAGRAIAALSEGTSDRHPAPAVKYETPTRQLIPSAVTPDGVDAPAHAEAFPEEPFQCAAGTSQSQPASTNSVHTPKAGRQLDPVLGINKAGLADETVGQLQATLGQPVMEPRASGTSAPGMFIDVQGLRQGLGSVLQQMTHLAANLHGLEQQLQQQQQHLPESRNLNPAEPHQAQHGNAAGAVNASESVQTTGDQDKLVAAEQLVTHVPTSLQQHSMHSMRQEAEQACKKPPTVQPLSGAVVRQHHESTLQADGQHAGMIMQAVMCDGAANAVSTPFGIEHVPGNKPIGLDEEENRQERRPIAPQVPCTVDQSPPCSALGV